MRQLFIYILFIACVGMLATGCSNTRPADDEGSTQPGSVLDGSIAKKDLKKKAVWKKVIAVKDVKSGKSKTFKINGSEWKIRWKTKPGKAGDDEFIVLLNDKDNQTSEVIANVSGSDEDFAFLEGKGEYYLQITTGQPYEIVVEEVR